MRPARITLVVAAALVLGIMVVVAGTCGCLAGITLIPIPISRISCTATGIYGQKDYNAWIRQDHLQAVVQRGRCRHLRVGRVHPHRQPATRYDYGSGLAVPRSGHQHLLPRADAQSCNGLPNKGKCRVSACGAWYRS